MTDNPFAPIAGGESAPRDDQPGGFEPLPLPPDPPKPPFRHNSLGPCTGTWPYHAASGAFAGYVTRYDPPGRDKVILPLRWGRVGGKVGWHRKGWGENRPLYGLRALSERTGSAVIVTEGEKACDAAARLFPELVAVAAMGGAGAPSKTDWTPVKGRRVVISGDHDEPGARYVVAVAELARAAGAKSIEILPPEALGGYVIKDGRPVPRGGPVPKSWDLADTEKDGWSGPLIEAFGRDHPLFKPYGAPPSDESIPPIGGGDGGGDDDGPFILSPRGLFWKNPDQSRGGLRWLCGPITVEAETRDSAGGSWGLLLRWRDPDKRDHSWAMPRDILAGDGAALRAELLARGLAIAADREGRALLIGYFTSVRRAARIRSVTKIGWDGCHFVLPGMVFGATGAEKIVLQSPPGFEHRFRTSGSLEGWRKGVAAPSAGNSTLVFAIAMAFAGPMLHPMGAEGAIIHLRGASSVGKSTALAVAGSVCGGGGKGYIDSWRSTDNALEIGAVSHNHVIWCLDEIAEIDAKAAVAAAYLIVNGVGKARASRAGEHRPVQSWRTLVLSSGEISLETKVAEAGPRVRVAAGAGIRLIDIPADANAGFGLFDHLAGHERADLFAKALKAATEMHFGFALPEWLGVLTGDLDAIVAEAQRHVSLFIERVCPTNCDGQVRRVAARFGMIGAAGEAATRAGITGWPAGEATVAAAKLFERWIEARGGVGPAEVSSAIAELRAFLLAHGQSRFAPADGDIRTDTNGGLYELTVRDRVGWRKRDPIVMPAAPDDGAGSDKPEDHKPTWGWTFLLTPIGLRAALPGRDTAPVLREMAKRGWLVLGDGGRLQKKTYIAGVGTPRLYHIAPNFLTDSDDE